MSERPCQGCGEPILWTHTDNCKKCQHKAACHVLGSGRCQAGKRKPCLCLEFEAKAIPLDPEPVDVWERGLLRFESDDTVVMAREGDPGPFYRAHFATCPESASFRR